jgi:hypothetical protein
MSDDETIKQEAAPESEAAQAERKAAKSAAAQARAKEIEEHKARKAALAARKAKAAETLAMREARRAEKRPAKEAQKAQRKAKTPEDLAAQAERKAAKQQAKESAKAARDAKAAQTAAARAARKAEKQQAGDAGKAAPQGKPPVDPAAKAERKAAKRQTKEAAKAERRTKTPEELAAKTERKTAKRQAKEARKPVAKSEAPENIAAKPEGESAGKTPEELAAKAERKAAKRREKEAAKTAREAKSAQTAAAKAARKAEKQQAEKTEKAQPESKPAVDPAAKAERKAAKRQTKEAAKAERRTKSPEDLEAKAARKAAKHAAKEAKKPKAESPGETPEALAAAKAQRKEAKRREKESAKAARDAKAAQTAAARAARKAEKKRSEDAGTAQSESKPPVDPAAKAERKAAKRQTKEAAKAQRRAKTPEELAAKAEQKAAKQAAKESKKTETASKSETPEELAAKAERKAAKQAAKEAKKAKPESASKTPEELAAQAERKAAKQAAKEAKKAKTENASKTPEELSAQAERKAAKQAAKEAKKAKTESAGKTPEELSAQAERKAAKQAAKDAKKTRAEGVAAAKAERKAAKEGAEETPEEKAARKAAKKQAEDAEPLDPEKAAKKAAKQQQAKAERKASKGANPEDAAAKAERKAKKAKGEDGEPAERAVRLSLAGATPEEVTPLGAALQAGFTQAGTQSEAPKPDGKCDIVVHTFDDADAASLEHYAGIVVGQKARVHVFVETLEEGGAVNRAIARLAAMNGGAVVSTRPRLKRFGLEQTSADGRPNEQGIKLIAEAIVGIATRLPRHTVNPQAGEAPADLVEARAAAEQPMELLAKLRWSAMTPPRALGATIHEDEVVAFADSKVVLSEENSIPLANPIDWSVELPDRRSGYVFHGLDFLASPLAYWYAKANNQASDRTVAIDAALKERGTNPTALFARVTQILVDFIAKNPRATAPKLWDESIVLRRAPVLAMFVLCCRVAYRRKLKFNESAFTQVYDCLLEHAEILRGDDFYVPASTDGIEQDRLLIGIGLSLRGTPYGNQLMSDGLERLKRLQIDTGLSAEGVWMGDSYGKHNLALTEITDLFGDFPPTESALLEPLAAATKKMTLFSEAMLKSNGQPLAFDGTREKVFSKKISGMRKSIARASGKSVSSGKSALTSRITDTYVFREAQYFISHSQQKVVPESSLVVLHAAPPSIANEDPGGVKLVFAYNESNLLIRAEPPEEEGKDEKPDETDPALRNFYRIDGKGNLAPESGSPKAARMVKSWRGPGWAAAKAFENNYESASVARTVIHLKAQHALIVVDELASDQDALFEQFWNMGPDFTAPETMAMPLPFTSDGKGVVSVVLAGLSDVSAAKAEAGTTLRGTVTLAQGAVGSLFQWTDEAAPAALSVARKGPGEWTATASGKDFSARLTHAGNDLTCEIGEG